ncbi:hypothetical protein KR215_001313, partial [Drosophila sulfurigaster]
MIEGRRSIHQPMRNLIEEITNLYKEIKVDSLGTSSPVQKGEDKSSQKRNVGKESSRNLGGGKVAASADTAATVASRAREPMIQAGKPMKENKAREGRCKGGDKQQRESWTKVEPKKKRVRQSRPDAIVIQGATGVSYVDILRSVKTEPRLKDLAQLVKGIRKTAKGELLFELVRASDPNTKVVQEAVSTLLGDKAEVRTLSETVSL